MTSAASAACPKCGATTVQSVPIKRGSVPEALAAEYFRGTPAGSRADTIQQSVCTRCGCHWIPRTTQEHHLRAVSGQLGPEAMKAAQAEDAAAAIAAGKASPRTTMPSRIPVRTWIIFVTMVVVILLAIFT